MCVYVCVRVYFCVCVMCAYLPHFGCLCYGQVRVLRPLKTLNKLKGLRVIVKTLLEALPDLAQALILLAFLFTVFSIIGVQVGDRSMLGALWSWSQPLVTPAVWVSRL